MCELGDNGGLLLGLFSIDAKVPRRAEGQGQQNGQKSCPSLPHLLHWKQSFYLRQTHALRGDVAQASFLGQLRPVRNLT